MEITASRTSRLKVSAMAALITLGLSLTANTQAFDKLTEAQSWIYDHNHLSNTQEGQVVEYRYTGADDKQPVTEDVATLAIDTRVDEERRHVKVEFLSGDNRLSLPPFENFRGNPIIIAMLEHVAQSLGSKTGGGVLYFRNRIRDALASEAVKLDNATSAFQDEQVATTTLTFQPFVDDAYLQSDPMLREAEFTIQLSDEVPAGVLSIGVKATSDDQRFERQLALQ